MRREDAVEVRLSGVPLARGARPASLRRSAPSVVPRARAALFLRARPPYDEANLVAQARTFALSLPVPVRLQVCLSLDGAQAFVYAWMEPGALDACSAEGSRAARLEPLAEWDGVSAAGQAPYHYAVTTDVAPENEADFNRWYDREHMPGLAGVAGTVHCARLRSREPGLGEARNLRYHACYDLVAPEVLNSAEWLALRRTAWASRVRRHFANARRLMFRTLLDERRLAVSGAYF